MDKPQPQLPSQLQSQLQLQSPDIIKAVRDHKLHLLFNLNPEGECRPNLHHIYLYPKIGIARKLPVIKLLLRYGAASILNFKDSSDNDSTILHRAAAKGDLQAARLFIKHGSDVNATDAYGKTPLHYAMRALQYSKELKEWVEKQNGHDNYHGSCSKAQSSEYINNDNNNNNNNRDCSRDSDNNESNYNNESNESNEDLLRIAGSKYLKMIGLLLKKGADSKLCVYRQENNLNVALDIMRYYCNCHNIVELLKGRKLL